jgi:hypothetical protein
MSARPRSRSALATLTACALALAICALAVPSGAAALVGKFAVGGSHGYRLTVFDYGFGVTLRVTRAKGSEPASSPGTWIYYIARAKRGNLVSASFGDLGRVEMRFRPSREAFQSRRLQGCRGPDRYTYRRGSFVGSFEFRGEGRFTAVNVHRAQGTVVTPHGRLHCRTELEPAAVGGLMPAPGGRRVTSLFAGWRSGLVARFFLAATDGHDPAGFEARSYETRGALAILRRTLVKAPDAAFATDGALGFATLTPPAPFSGSGYLRRDASGARVWEGSLAVTFPGQPSLPLTGPEYRTGLTRNF